MAAGKHRVTRAAVLWAVVMLCAVAGARPAAAADQLTIRRVDTSKFPVVKISALVTGAAPDLKDFALRENGKIIPGGAFNAVPISETKTALVIALVIDTSGSMKGARLAAAKAAAHQFVDHKLPNDDIAIVSFSSEPRVVVNFTSDAALLSGAIDSLQASGETALWDAIRAASAALASQAPALPYMVVLSDGADTVSKSAVDEALGAATAAKVGVFAVGLTGPGDFDGAALRRVTDATQGSYVETADAAKLAQLYASVQRTLQNQYEVTYTSSAHPGPLAVSLAVGGAQATASGTTGGVTDGSSAHPVVVASPKVPAALRSGSAKVLVAALVGLAAGVLALALLLIFGRRDPSLETAMRPYAGGERQADAAAIGDRTFVQTALVRRAVETTARLARQGAGVERLERLERRLDQADLRLRAQEALFFYMVAVFFISVVVLLVAGPLLGAAALIFSALAPLALLSQLADRRLRSFTRQLPDTLQLLSSSLRAGYSMQQGLETVAQEVEDPMGRELRRVVLEARLGRSLEESLEDTARRMASPDFDWVVMAIRIQREIGGNLAELLTTVSETMIARERLRREVSALTAEGKLSAIVVGALPILVGIAIFVLNPSYIRILFTNTIGKGMILGAVVLALAGFAWMKKVIEIDV